MSEGARAIVIGAAVAGGAWLWQDHQRRTQAATQAQFDAVPLPGGGDTHWALAAADPAPTQGIGFDAGPLLAWGFDTLIGALENRQTVNRTPPIAAQPTQTTQGQDMNTNGGIWGRIFGGSGASAGGGTAQAGAGGASAGAGYFDNGLPASIIRTESGGNTFAYNNEQGAGGHYGHGGRGQFGTARLQDAYRAGALDRPMTAAEFARAPLAVQERVERWHVRDIGNYIERNNLDRYIGQTVGGVEVTPNGMIAAAHLGGSGGLRRWLESGGSRNPSDSFGTSLTDYMRTHWGWG